jgi:hypothetical protein
LISISSRLHANKGASSENFLKKGRARSCPYHLFPTPR